MNLHQIKFDLLPFAKHILIIGPPASGKTFVSRIIKAQLPTHRIFHSDDYMDKGWEQSLYALIEDIKQHEGPTIVEGLQGYRLLRKGIELDCYHPDIVIEIEVTDYTIESVYHLERDPSKLKSVLSSVKACDTVLVKYRGMEKTREPYWIKIDNNIPYSSSSLRLVSK